MTLVLDMASKHPVIDHNDDFSLGLYKMAEFSNLFCNLWDNEKKNKIVEYFCDVENEWWKLYQKTKIRQFLIFGLPYCVETYNVFCTMKQIGINKSRIQQNENQKNSTENSHNFSTKNTKNTKLTFF